MLEVRTHFSATRALRKVIGTGILAATMTLAMATTASAQGTVYADSDFGTCDANSYTMLGVLANDWSMGFSLDPGSVVIVVEPEAGDCAVDPVDGTVYYYPAPNASGYDSFAYQVCDSNGNWSNVAWVGVHVFASNIAPAIVGFTVSHVAGDTWEISGWVVDTDFVDNLDVTITSSTSSTATYSTSTMQNGFFSTLLTLNIGQSGGTISARAEDNHGAQSEVAEFFINPQS